MDGEVRSASGATVADETPEGAGEDDELAGDVQDQAQLRPVCSRGLLPASCQRESTAVAACQCISRFHESD